MKMRYATAFVLLLLMFGIASAQEIGTAQENVCHEGGLFFRDGASLCETEWHWTCGWYIANWQNTGTSAPDWCGTGHLPVSAPILDDEAPPDDETPPDPVYPGCVPVDYDETLHEMSPESDYYYADFGDQFILARPLMLYSIGCETLLISTLQTIVYASSTAEALNLCLTLPSAYDVSHNPAYPNIYTCLITPIYN